MKEHRSEPQVPQVPVQGLPGDAADAALQAALAGDERVDTVLIPRSVLRARVTELAREIAADHGDADVLHMVAVLKGALFFAKDLSEALYECGGPPLRLHCLKASTYGMEIKAQADAARQVRMELAPGNLEGRHVLLVDDLLDQGYTLSAVREYLRSEGRVASLRTCVLLDKMLHDPPESVRRLRAGLRLEHVGFRVPDRWVAGYGIDAAGDFRNLPFVVAVNERHYLGNQP